VKIVVASWQLVWSLLCFSQIPSLIQRKDYCKDPQADMRLLFITTGLGTGGAERMLVKLLSMINCPQLECSVVSLLDSGTQGARLRDLGVPVHELHVNSLRGLISAVWRLQNIVHNLKPDIIQGWMYHGNLAACYAWLGTRTRSRLFWGVRHSFMGMKCERPMTRLVIRVGAILSRFPTYVIFNSQLSRNQHEALGFCSGRNVVIPNGFLVWHFRPNTEARAEMRRALGISPEAPVVGMVARDHPMKDHATFLNAAALVLKQCPSAVFVLAGPGIDRSNFRLVFMIKQLGIGESVRLVGEVTDTEFLYPAFDVLGLSSWAEAFPNVLGEAMACGIPCVATDVGDARQIIGDTGYVVSPSCPAELATKLLVILSVEKTDYAILSKRARQRIREHYSLDRIANCFRNVYASFNLDRNRRAGYSKTAYEP
jgi:glycosyltransferase involved in cell wall biosynthesis